MPQERPAGVQWEAEAKGAAAAGRPRQDSRGWHLHPRLWVTSSMLRLVGGLCSVGASRVGPRAGLLCWLPLMVTCVSSTQMRKLKPGLAAESGREGAGLCLHPWGSPLPLAPQFLPWHPKWEAHIQPPFLRRARDRMGGERAAL